MFLYQTHSRRPPHITGRVVNTVTRGWVGAPNERIPFRFHDAVVGFFVLMSVDHSESHRFELSISLSVTWPNILPAIVFFRFFAKFISFK